MEFHREFIEATLTGLRFYGIPIAILIGIMVLLSVRQEARTRGAAWDMRLVGLIILIVGAIFAGAWFLLMPAQGPRVQIRYYGIIIVVAMLVATAVAARLAQRTGRDPEHVYGALTWAIVPGIIFARLWHVLFPGQAQVAQGLDRAHYLQNFFDLNTGAIAIWSGGLSIFGAILGGLVGTYIYLRRNNLPVGPWLDIAAIVVPLGQAIGRWANYVNQELYGLPTDLPWGIPIDRTVIQGTEYAAIDYARVINGELVWTFHPLFLYESLWSLGAFFVLLYLYNRYRDRFKPGDFFLIYIAQYSFIRFFLEFLRVEVTLVGGINLSQVVTVVAFILAVGALIYRHRRGTETSGYAAPLPSEQPKASEHG